MKPVKTWVLIANGITAHVMENTGPGTGLQVVAGKVWQAPEKDSYESEQGMTNNSTGRSMHRMAPHNSPDKAESAFAADIAAHLSQDLAKGGFDRLVLVAAPKMLGFLRPELDAQLADKVIAELPKDLVKTPNADLNVHFANILRL